MKELNNIRNFIERYFVKQVEETGVYHKDLKEKILNDLSTIEQILKEHEQYKAIEKELGIDLLTFLKGVNPNTCFMEITRYKKFYFYGDAYYGTYTKEELLELIQHLLFMYWALTKEELL